MSCTVIVPTYNEVENLPQLVRRLRSVVPDIQILVVDDNSPDGTAKLADSLGCSVIVRTNKRGLSSAVIDGFKSVESEDVVVMDADLQHSPELVPDLLKSLETFPMVVASRYCKGGSIEDWSLSRRFVSWGANLLSLPLAPRVRDRTSGYFALRRDALPSLDKLNGTGFKIMLEVLVKSGISNVGEVPCCFVPRARGVSKFDARQIREYIRHLVRLYIYKYKRFAKFCMVGATGVGVNQGILALFLWLWGDQLYALFSVVAIETSIITNFALNNIWTFRDRRTMGSSVPARLLKYNITCGIGAGLNFSILVLLKEILGMDPLIANLFGISGAMLWNYAGSTLWAWRVKQSHAIHKKGMY